MVSTSPTAEETKSTSALDIICAINMHQCFHLPASEIHGRLRVTYSTTSNFSDASLPVILFCGPMFGSRYLNLMLNHLAKTTGVRVICVDRPGMGGSTVVPLDIRIKVWLETVPALLDRLNVQHVSLLSHSAGTIYALNTLHKLRHILDPNAPYFASLCPWVHYEHSGVSMLNIASRLPNRVLDYWNTLGKFAGTRVEPSFAWSGSIFSSVSSIWSGKSRTDDDDQVDELVEKYGTSRLEAMEIEKLQVKYFFAEDTTGANEEARLCLKMNGNCHWESCENYEEYIEALVRREGERLQSHPDTPLLKIRAYFAASDVMIGNQGQRYFETCWRRFGNSAVVDYDDTVLSKTNHDSVLTDLRHGALAAIFAEVSQAGTRREEIAT